MQNVNIKHTVACIGKNVCAPVPKCNTIPRLQQKCSKLAAVTKIRDQKGLELKQSFACQ